MWAVLPVKNLAQSKQRLAATLSASERYALVAAMTGDTLSVLAASPAVHGILIVTNDFDVIEIAELYGIEVLPEPESGGLNAAVTVAAKLLAERGKANMLVIHNDIPLLSVASLDEMAYQHGRWVTEKGGITLVSDAAGEGSNAVIFNPPMAIAFQYGEKSCEKHKAKAQEKNYPFNVLNAPALSLDVDDEAGLKVVIQKLLKEKPLSLTSQWLKDSGTAQRFGVIVNSPSKAS